MNKGISQIATMLITFLITAIIASGGIYYLSQKHQNELSDLNDRINSLNLSLANEKSSSKVTTATPTTTPTTDSSWKTYTNSDYGFTLTFPGDWVGYRVKEVKLTGITKTYYFSVPTTDASWNDASSSFPGFASLFALGVYTKAEWDAVQASGGPTDTQVSYNSQYVFAYSQSQALPADIQNKNLASEIKTIINSFNFPR